MNFSHKNEFLKMNFSHKNEFLSITTSVVQVNSHGGQFAIVWGAKRLRELEEDKVQFCLLKSVRRFATPMPFPD
jgi:hypothetical protein